jgi:hypothetical protein
MALTAFQRNICNVIARNRIESGESYVAGGVALNEFVFGQRVSNDIDLFHDTSEAVATSFQADRALLESNGYALQVERERPGYVEALVRKQDERVAIQWAADSAFRFFPLVEHDEFGLTLHPVDLATNKVLALVGRLEVRDWIDVINCDARIQPFGYLAWAASGKDPAFSPNAILAQGARTARYSKAEIESLAFDGPPPDAEVLARRWHEMLAESKVLVSALPPSQSGKCVLAADGVPFRGDIDALRSAVDPSSLIFHSGRVRGALPQLRNVT